MVRPYTLLSERVSSNQNAEKHAPDTDLDILYRKYAPRYCHMNKSNGWMDNMARLNYNLLNIPCSDDAVPNDSNSNL